MTHPLIQQIATDLAVSIEEVNAVIAGEMLPSDEKLLRIMNALGADGLGVYICTVWKGDAVPNTLRNTPIYGYFGQILEALNLTLDKKRYTSRLQVSHLDLADYRYFEEAMTRQANAGIIDIAANLTEALQRACKTHQRPVLYIDFPADEAAADQYIISAESQPAVEKAVAQLYQLGHRRIAFIAGPQNKISAIDRLEGYRTGLMKVGIDYDAALVQPGHWNPIDGEAAVEKLLALNHPPTALIASNDMMAFGAMSAIQRHGLKIPDDISVIGYDDIAAAAMTTPPLTSIRLPMSEIGAKAGETIIELLEGRQPESRQVYFPLELMVRGSIGPVHVS